MYIFINPCTDITLYLLSCAYKDINIRCVLVISLINDKTLNTTKPGILSINDR